MSNQEVDQFVTDFNSTILDLARNLATISPESLIGTNLRNIESVLNDPENKLKIIDIFVARVLQYKQQIDKGDENFFLNNTYSDQYGGNDQYVLDKIFEFKNIWATLSQADKQCVTQYMQILCMLAQEYFVRVC